MKKFFSTFLLFFLAIVLINTPTAASARGAQNRNLTAEQKAEREKAHAEHKEKMKAMEAAEQKKDDEAGIKRSVNRHITISTVPAKKPIGNITKTIEVKNADEKTICHAIAYKDESGREIIVGMGCVKM